MMPTIKLIDFDTVYSVWNKHLWLHRTDKIETHSAMLYLTGYDLKNFNYIPSFFGCFVDNKLAGVNSGHLCIDSSYRSRGLFVFEEFRGKNIGVNLLSATIEQAKNENAKFIWSYPRLNSYKTYKKAGFIISTDWTETENGKNAFCVLTF